MKKKSLKKKKPAKTAKEEAIRAASTNGGADPARVWMSPDYLHFDIRNPRVVETHLDETSSEEEFITVLWKELAVEEVAISIASNGYFSHEPLFAIREDDRNIVIEGNRRLAAVKLLLNERLQRKIRAVLPELTDDVRKTLKELPVYITRRDESWHYIGFKHVNGPRPWGAWSKAEYIARVHDEFDVPLKEISERIGDRHATVQRLYRGLMTIRQVDESGEWKIGDRWNKRLYFSHLYTGLSYEPIQQFIGLREESSYRPKPVKGMENLKRLGEVCTWMYGSKSKELRPLIKSQNPDLRNLSETISTKRGVDALRAGMPLQSALDVSLGDERIFREALASAKASLQRAAGTVLTGYDLEEDTHTTAKDIYTISGDILDTMDEMHLGRKRKRTRRGQR